MPKTEIAVCVCGLGEMQMRSRQKSPLALFKLARKIKKKVNVRNQVTWSKWLDKKERNTN